MSLSKEVSSLLVSEKALHLLLHGISGGVAGVLSTLVLYPIDNVKTRLQAMIRIERDKIEYNEAESPHNNKSRSQNKVVQTVQDILRKDGALGLYKGMLPYLIGTLISFGVYFFWYELFKGYFIKGKFSLVGYSITALLAGLITATCANPFWLIHTRVLLEKQKSPGLLAAIKMIYEKEGPEGFVKGLGAAYILVANPIIQYVIYEYLKKKFQHNTSSAMVFLIGAISKALATLVTYPYSILKTNIQANKHRVQSQRDMIKEILESKGFKGFYSGFGTKISQSVINSALMLVIYERVQNIIKQLLLAILTKK